MYIKLINRYFILTTILLFAECNNNDYDPNLLKPKTKNNCGEILFGLEKNIGKAI